MTLLHSLLTNKKKINTNQKNKKKTPKIIRSHVVFSFQHQHFTCHASPDIQTFAHYVENNRFIFLLFICQFDRSLNKFKGDLKNISLVALWWCSGCCLHFFFSDQTKPTKLFGVSFVFSFLLKRWKLRSRIKHFSEMRDIVTILFFNWMATTLTRIVWKMPSNVHLGQWTNSIDVWPMNFNLFRAETCSKRFKHWELQVLTSSDSVEMVNLVNSIWSVCDPK